MSIQLEPKPASESTTLQGAKIAARAASVVLSLQAVAFGLNSTLPNREWVKTVNVWVNVISVVAGAWGIKGSEQARQGRMNLGDLYTKPGEPGPNKEDLISPQINGLDENVRR